MKCVLRTLVILLLFISTGRPAAAATKFTPSPELTQRVDRLLKQLEDGTFEQRESADQELLKVPIDALRMALHQRGGLLEPLGIHFDTDNDTEAACRFLEWRLREGDDLHAAIHAGFKALDGFYTFLMGTDTELAIVRDAFACKPAIVAETEDYVAIASEFRSLAHLPGVRKAKLFEPKPQEIYTWHI